MANKLRNIALIGIFILTVLPGCMYDLDVGGVISTESNVNERFTESMLWNAANNERISSTDGREYTIYFGGDPHVGGIENLESLIKVAHDSLAMAMVIAGDVSTGKPGDYDILDSVLTRTTFVQNCVVVGNHDLYFDGWRSFHEHFGSTTYKMEVITADATDLYVFLDTGGGTLGSMQLNWLQDLLETQRDQYRYVVVTTHLNFFRNRLTGSTNPLNEEIMLLLDLFEQSEVNLLISGHDHDRYIEVFGHCTYITLDAMVDGVEQASYMVLKVDEEGLDYNFVKF